jgi:hypothetical protein
MGEFTGRCPSCKTELEFSDLPRYNTERVCPNCKTPLMIEFDFIVTDDGDEWDLYILRLKNQ